MERTFADWPVKGPIDLAVHDLPHRSSATEWWYVNTHVKTVDGRELSLFAAFFRIIKGKDEATGEPTYAHSCTWALSDAAAKTYLARSRVDASAPQMGIERIKNGRGSRDPRLNRAMLEILERGKIPAPDRIFEGPVHVGMRRFELDFDGQRYSKNDDGSYRLELTDRKLGVGADLTFHPQKPVTRHGDDGVVRGPNGEDMFYYFIPRCRVDGSVTVHGSTLPVATGQGWYDHEFGGPRPAAPDALLAAAAEPAEPAEQERPDVAWNWAAVQLDSGEELTAYALVRVVDGAILGQWAIHIDSAGYRHDYTDMSFTPDAKAWRSTRTFYDYPLRWRLQVPEAKIDLTLDAAFADQEFITCISKPAFWEGRINASGSVRGAAVAGLGYIERSGFEPVRDLDEFFSAVGEEVRRSVAALMPLEPTHAEVRDLIAGDEREQYMDGVDTAQIARSLFKPLRDIADRGGKSWRSYAALACCDVVEGDSRKFVQWLAIPELMHVGSLIVDDVEDKSTLRRGGPACHLIHGEPIAINSGTAGYFITQRLLRTSEVSAHDKLRLYDLYFEAMRAGHAGQAIDLDGLDAQLERAVVSGDSRELERAVLAKHRLKAAAPAAALARMGAVAGGGSDAQIEAVGRFFEALGLAFQIVDDVLNLRGFKGDLKARGEDITNGSITHPVAKAMGRLDAAGRRALSNTLKSKPEDPTIVSAVVEQLETIGAVQACADEARDLVEAAWQAADPLLPDTIPKVMLRAFGWYILERHY
ncbi:MAG: Octaprenyl diphosphate synthase [Myxococcales bacterium]|nr:Octaprenyl diphosphate synthase [Myxococcales bacterium]